MKKITTIILLIFLTYSTAFAKPMNNEDPYEEFNRSMFDFNMEFNNYIGQPVGKAYKNYIPSPIQKGTSNFLIFLSMTINMIINFFQGEIERGLGDFMRFSINTVFGLGGIIDIATPAGLPYEKEDLGQTLYKWGVWDDASFVVLPIVGAYTTRELLGSSVDGLYDPTYRYIIQTDLKGEIAVFLIDKFNNYIKVLDLAEQMRYMPDPYIFYRETYLQYRTNLIYNGHPPLPEIDDFDFN
jgi:phospholipid-binding lipoprotein MlaA